MNRDSKQAPIALPDFCQPTAVLLTVLLALMLALLLTLAASPGLENFWVALGPTALMVECIVLASSLLLCIGRNRLARIRPVFALVIVFCVIQLLTIGCSLIALELFPALLVRGGAPEPVGWIARNVLISLIASLVFVRYLALYRQWRLQVRAEANARLDALQARIRPHFLFNSLNTIANLIPGRPRDAEESLLDLSDLLRTGLEPGGSHALSDELELVRGYLRIESQRLGDRLAIDWRIADDLPLSAEVPALLLQPLVENAVIHGIARRPEGGTLTIEARRAGRARWRLVIENPLPDSDSESEQPPGHRMALDNIAQRLELAFGDRARLTTRTANRHFIAEVVLPIRGT